MGDSHCVRLVDSPPIRTTAGTHDSFISLQPGNLWSYMHEARNGILC